MGSNGLVTCLTDSIVQFGVIVGSDEPELALTCSTLIIGENICNNKTEAISQVKIFFMIV
jgi:benzoyl-CoA reductase/2-hydroxyglutaryl-CoA dehydratase subunit BcrC/BadD/HgdB